MQPLGRQVKQITERRLILLRHASDERRQHAISLDERIGLHGHQWRRSLHGGRKETGGIHHQRKIIRNGRGGKGMHSRQGRLGKGTPLHTALPRIWFLMSRLRGRLKTRPVAWGRLRA